MSKSWYALRVKPHRERTVLQRLEAEGVENYLPMVRVQPKNPRAATRKPYFPGYLFIATDLDELGTNLFKWMPGAIGLVEFGGIPAVVPESLIKELRQLIAKIEEEGGLAYIELQKGDRVRIVEGPFAGYEAIFDAHLPGKDRVQVLLAFLSQNPQRLRLDVQDVKKLKS